MLPVVAIVIALVGRGVRLTLVPSRLLERDHSSPRRMSRARATVFGSFDGCELSVETCLQRHATIVDGLADIVEQRTVIE
ncbi:hypothetical protein C476_09773 [Natrinema limicola JCM 13563]|uniref:Uncharacterized protein n=2 Tax=Natrinema limicola TaxID=370323 RepID=M0CGB4_9EURY|nr:hypothetical protein C476_09773 [Natrinema limicola JCM 13563]